MYLFIFICASYIFNWICISKSSTVALQLHVSLYPCFTYWIYIFHCTYESLCIYYSTASLCLYISLCICIFHCISASWHLSLRLCISITSIAPLHHSISFHISWYICKDTFSTAPLYLSSTIIFFILCRNEKYKMYIFHPTHWRAASLPNATLYTQCPITITRCNFCFLSD